MKTINGQPDLPLSSKPARRRILVLESDRLIRELLLEWLQMSGDDAVWAADLPAAEPLPEGCDLILIDLPSPHRAAQQVVARLRRAVPRTPIVAMSADVTASGRDAHESLARELGATALLVKPFTRNALLSAMDRARM